ncbi:MAG TPA: hypothetical protein P5083_01155 [Candidatus Paceibacterota bacterium]|nr:hypothetical protein [Candidatus Paceibacterota bacterium]
MKKIIIMALAVIVLSFLLTTVMFRIFPFHDVTQEYNKCVGEYNENYDEDLFVDCINGLFKGNGIFVYEIN